jgi:hypothetical protein
MTNEGRNTFSTFWKTGFNSFDQVLAFDFLQPQLPVFPQVPNHVSGPAVCRTRPLTPSPALRWRSVILWRYTTGSLCRSTFNGLRVSAVRHIQYPLFWTHRLELWSHGLDKNGPVQGRRKRCLHRFKRMFVIFSPFIRVWGAQKREDGSCCSRNFR